MTQFAGGSTRTESQLAIHNDTTADSCSDRNEDHGISRLPCPKVNSPRGPFVRRSAERPGNRSLREDLRHLHIAPLSGQVGQELRHASTRIDQARNADSQRGRLCSSARREVANESDDAFQNGCWASWEFVGVCCSKRNLAGRAGERAGDFVPPRSTLANILVTGLSFTLHDMMHLIY